MRLRGGGGGGGGEDSWPCDSGGLRRVEKRGVSISNERVYNTVPNRYTMDKRNQHRFVTKQ